MCCGGEIDLNEYARFQSLVISETELENPFTVDFIAILLRCLFHFNAYTWCIKFQCFNVCIKSNSPFVGVSALIGEIKKMFYIILSTCFLVKFKELYIASFIAFPQNKYCIIKVLQWFIDFDIYWEILLNTSI